MIIFCLRPLSAHIENDDRTAPKRRTPSMVLACFCRVRYRNFKFNQLQSSSGSAGMPTGTSRLVFSVVRMLPMSTPMVNKRT